jgi:hypothetical protein
MQVYTTLLLSCLLPLHLAQMDKVELRGCMKSCEEVILITQAVLASNG